MTDELQLVGNSGRRTRALLNRMISGKQLSEDGLRWLVQQTDPFHDSKIEPTGYPDGDISRSIVRCIRVTDTLTKPGTLAAGKWDARVDLYPVLGGTPVARTTQSYPDAPSVGGSFALARGPLSVVSGPVGFAINNATAVVDNRWSIDWTRYTAGRRVRLVGVGFEVANVTDALHKAGSVTCWRSHARSDDVSVRATTAPDVYRQVRWLSGFPFTLGELSAAADAVTWEAADGCYVVGTPDDNANPPQGQDWRPVVIGALQPGTPGHSVGFVADNTAMTIDLNYGGAYFAGLSEESALTVTVKYFLEEFPLPSSDMYSLARPTVAYDPLAIKLFGDIMREMPVGVRLAENFDLGWFKDVLDVAANALPMLKSLPVVGGAADTLGKLAKGASKALYGKPAKAQSEPGGLNPQGGTAASTASSKKKP